MADGSFIPFSRPEIGQDEIEEVCGVLRSDWLTSGPQTRLFEQEFARFLGSPGALALNSCTAALHTALVTLGVSPGAEVITTPMTFAASVNVIEHVGARPVLADIEADTLNLDPACVASVVTRRTRAVIPVHYAGHPVDLGPLRCTAEKFGLAVLEDAAHALPARYNGKRIGSGTNPVAFSFYATKNLTTGEGGMLTGDSEFLERARVVSLHGMSSDAWRRYEKSGSWRYDVGLPGFKYNMTDIAAAIGRVQLKKLDMFQARRRAIVERYRRAFGANAALEMPVERAKVEHAWHLFVIRLRLNQLKIDRDRFIEELGARGIGTSVHFIPIHMHSYYRKKYGWREEDLPVASAAFDRIVSLPLYPGLTDESVDAVVEAVIDVTRKFGK